MKKVRNIRWHTVLIDTLKTETSNLVLNPCHRLSLPLIMEHGSVGAAPIATLDNGTSAPIATLDNGTSAPIATLDNGTSAPIATLDNGTSAPIANLDNGTSAPIANLDNGARVCGCRAYR